MIFLSNNNDLTTIMCWYDGFIMISEKREWEWKAQTEGFNCHSSKNHGHGQGRGEWRGYYCYWKLSNALGWKSPFDPETQLLVFKITSKI